MFAYLARQSKPLLVVYAALLTLLVCLAQHLTGPGQSVLLFYVLPVALISWFVGRGAGLLISALSAVTWLGAEIWSHEQGAAAAVFWNIVMRLGTFLVISFTIAEFARAKNRQDELLQFIVHDLRSPLTNVLSGLQTLQQEPGMDDWQRELVDMAEISADRMLSLINSLLDLPRLESGNMPLRIEDTSIASVMEAAVQQVSLWTQQSGVRLETCVQDGVGPVRIDPEITVRVLVNLLGNALEWSPDNSIIGLEAFRGAPGMVTLAVTDRGPGIAPEWVDKVFSKYGQIEHRKSGKGSSTGLGLTFSAMAVKAQGGRIWIESELGAGTTVKFDVPMASEANE